MMFIDDDECDICGKIKPVEPTPWRSVIVSMCEQCAETILEEEE